MDMSMSGFKMRRDIGKIEELLQLPGDIKVLATIRILNKAGHAFVELESDQGVSRRLLKKMLRRMSLEMPNYD